MGIRVLPSQANFIMADFGKAGEELYQALLKKGILIRPLSAYGFNTWFRISIGLPEENRYFVEALSSAL
jgi:histidinol-phosphate aminotransferase